MTPSMVLTAHGSADPRSAEVARAVAGLIRRLRPGLDVRLAFCERDVPNLRDVLAGLDGPAVVTPLLLASAFHARVDIPAMIADANADRPGQVLQAGTLGEDPRLIEVLRQRLAAVTGRHAGRDVGVLVVAVGSSHAAANLRTATVAETLTADRRWAGVEIAFATGPQPGVADGIEALRTAGARHVAVAPWFVAPGRITDRVAAVAHTHSAVMADPLGAHRLLAATVLDRFDRAVAARVAA